MCKTKAIHANDLNGDEDSQDEQREDFFIGSISSENNKDEIYVNLKINNKIVKFKLDTGSQVNILTDKIYKKIQTGEPLVNTSVKLTSYSGAPYL